MIKKSLIFLSFAIFLTAGLAMAGPVSLYESLSRKGIVKVFVADLTDATAAPKADLPDLKKKIEEGLKNRKSIRFELVSKEDADILLEGSVTEFLWTDSDPVDMITGWAAAAIDAAKKDHYARLMVDFVIRDAKGPVLWQDKVRATLTDPAMTEAESLPRINDRMVEAFMRQALAKPRR